MPQSPKTNAARLLDKARIPYELISYRVDPSDLSATHVAETIGEPVELVYKTLTMRGDKTGIIVGVIPADKEVDLKKMAQISGNKKVEMLPLKELTAITGYIRGGCTAIGMKKPYPVFLHNACLPHPFFYVSAGLRGLQLIMSPTDYAAFTKAATGDIISDKQ